MSTSYLPSTFWTRLIETDILSSEQAERARRRFDGYGGPPDMAVLETQPLDPDERQALVALLSDATGLPIAPPEFLASPDLDALAFMPRPIAELHGLLPIKLTVDRLVVAAPALAPEIWVAIGSTVGRRLEPYVALEIELRFALQRHMDLRLPERLHALSGSDLDGARWLSRGPTPPPILGSDEAIEDAVGGSVSGALMAQDRRPVSEAIEPFPRLEPAPALITTRRDFPAPLETQPLNRLRPNWPEEPFEIIQDGVGASAPAGGAADAGSPEPRATGDRPPSPTDPSLQTVDDSARVVPTADQGPDAQVGALESEPPIAALADERTESLWDEPAPSDDVTPTIVDGVECVDEGPVVGGLRPLAVPKNLSRSPGSSESQPTPPRRETTGPAPNDILSTLRGFPDLGHPNGPNLGVAGHPGIGSASPPPDRPPEPLPEHLPNPPNDPALESRTLYEDPGLRHRESTPVGDDPGAPIMPEARLLDLDRLATVPVMRAMKRASLLGEASQNSAEAPPTFDLMSAPPIPGDPNAHHTRSPHDHADGHADGHAIEDGSADYARGSVNEGGSVSGSLSGSVSEAPEHGSVPGMGSHSPEPPQAITALASPAPAIRDRGSPSPELQQAITALASPTAAIREQGGDRVFAHGDDGLGALVEAFPGHLVVDRYGVSVGAVPVPQHSGVLESMLRFGNDAIPWAIRLAGHMSPEIRYYAVYLFSELDPVGVVSTLAARLFDQDPSVRDVAAYVLMPFRSHADFRPVINQLRSSVAGGPPATRRRAAQMVGRLRLVELIPNLIDALAEPGFFEIAHRTLVELTRHDFDHQAWQWKAWFERNRTAPRVEWLLDGLLSEDRLIRAGAFTELRRLTRLEHGYSVDGVATRRRVAVQRWARWWSEEGWRDYGDYG